MVKAKISDIKNQLAEQQKGDYVDNDGKPVDVDDKYKGTFVIIQRIAEPRVIIKLFLNDVVGIVLSLNCAE